MESLKRLTRGPASHLAPHSWTGDIANSVFVTGGKDKEGVIFKLRHGRTRICRYRGGICQTAFKKVHGVTGGNARPKRRERPQTPSRKPTAAHQGKSKTADT